MEHSGNGGSGVQGWVSAHNNRDPFFTTADGPHDVAKKNKSWLDKLQNVFFVAAIQTTKKTKRNTKW